MSDEIVAGLREAWETLPIKTLVVLRDSFERVSRTSAGGPIDAIRNEHLKTLNELLGGVK